MVDLRRENGRGPDRALHRPARRLHPVAIILDDQPCGLLGMTASTEYHPGHQHLIDGTRPIPIVRQRARPRQVNEFVDIERGHPVAAMTEHAYGVIIG